MKGIRRFSIQLASPSSEAQNYLVRLFFIEPDYGKSGKRVFDVALQDETVLEDLDIAQESGGIRRGIMKEFQNVKVKNRLVIDLTPDEKSPDQQPVLSGIEIIAKNQITQADIHK